MGKLKIRPVEERFGFKREKSGRAGLGEVKYMGHKLVQKMKARELSVKILAGELKIQKDALTGKIRVVPRKQAGEKKEEDKKSQ
jgi:hypothetical protein